MPTGLGYEMMQTIFAANREASRQPGRGRPGGGRAGRKAFGKPDLGRSHGDTVPSEAQFPFPAREVNHPARAHSPTPTPPAAALPPVGRECPGSEDRRPRSANEG